MPKGKKGMKISEEVWKQVMAMPKNELLTKGKALFVSVIGDRDLLKKRGIEKKESGSLSEMERGLLRRYSETRASEPFTGHNLLRAIPAEDFELNGYVITNRYKNKLRTLVRQTAKGQLELDIADAKTNGSKELELSSHRETSVSKFRQEMEQRFQEEFKLRKEGLIARIQKREARKARELVRIAEKETELAERKVKLMQ